MSISKLNAEQFSANQTGLKGIIFVYNGKEDAQTALQFFGEDYEPADKSQNSVFKAIKAVVATFWSVKEAETKLRADADGIRSKLRASTPSAIIIRTSKGELVKTYHLEDSVWARLGFVPTKKDLDFTNREKSKAIHNATKAIFDAMNFRVLLAKEEETPAVNADESKQPAAENADKTNKGKADKNAAKTETPSELKNAA
ncbi:hypothetical protein [Viscerimonas tarda]